MSESIPLPEHKETKKPSERTPEDISEDRLQTTIGILVVVLATFLGICNVKDGNICQAMLKTKSEENDKWAWYQARNIRGDLFSATADSMGFPAPGETDAGKLAREESVNLYRSKASDQYDKKAGLQEDAKKLSQAYDDLNDKDDEFDFCEASLSVALAMYGVTALIKRWWMLYFSLVPSTIGIFMGIAGFTDIAVKQLPIVEPVMKFLS